MKINTKTILINLLGSAILAFGFYNIHAQADVTEGGMLGLTLLVEHWLHISPAISGFVMSAACFFFAWKQLGWKFIHNLCCVTFSKSLPLSGLPCSHLWIGGIGQYYH